MINVRTVLDTRGQEQCWKKKHFRMKNMFVCLRIWVYLSPDLLFAKNMHFTQIVTILIYLFANLGFLL